MEAASRGRVNSSKLIAGAAPILGLVLLWQLAAVTGSISTLLFSSPVDVIAAGGRELLTPRFWNDVIVSGQEFILGYTLAAIVGIPFALAVGWYASLGYVVDPLLGFMNALPKIALLPLILLTIGIGLWAVVTVIFLGVFFTVVINTVQGVRVVEKRYLNVAQVYRASDLKRFRTVVLPSAMPFVVAGLRLGIGRALIGLVVGELFVAGGGLGHMIRVASYQLQSDRLLFATGFLIVASLLLSEGLRHLERRVAPWRTGDPLVGG